MAASEFTIVRGSNTIIACFDAGKLTKTLKKVWHAMAFLDRETLGGMAKNKLIKNTDMEKTSGAYIMDHGTKIPSGWQSTVLGIVADDPLKIRGDRADFLIYDESGCHAPGTEVIMADGKLKKVEDIVVGDLVMGDDSAPRKVLELHHGFLQMYKIIPTTGDTQIVNANHILYGKRNDGTIFETKINTIKSTLGLSLIRYNPDTKKLSTTPFTIEKLDVGEYYGFSLDGNQLFLLKDFTVCHNSWPGLETAVTQGEALIEIGGTRFGVMVFGGR